MYFNEAKQRYVISIRIFRAINCLFWQDLEKRIADVLRQAFAQCPTIDAQLRLLEVFEGISARELVQVRAGSCKCVQARSVACCDHSPSALK